MLQRITITLSLCLLAFCLFGTPPGQSRGEPGWGYIDRSGQVVIKPRFSDAYQFSDGIARVFVAPNFGYINRSGAYVVKPKYESANDFHEKVAVVQDGEFWGTIDRTGKTILKAQFSNMGDYENGIAQASKDWVAGFVDKTGAFVMPPRYQFVDPFYDGMAACDTGDGWAFVNSNFHEVFTGNEQDTRFSEGIAAVKVGGQWGLIDHHGTYIVRPGYVETGQMHNGLIWVRGKDQILKYLDKSGKVKITLPKSIIRVQDFSEGLALATTAHGAGYIDTSGAFKIPAKFVDGREFRNGEAIVTLAGHAGVIDKSGNFVIPPKYDFLGELQCGLRVASLKKLYGYVGSRGQPVVPLKYFEAKDFQEDMAPVLFSPPH